MYLMQEAEIKGNNRSTEQKGSRRVFEIAKRRLLKVFAQSREVYRIKTQECVYLKEQKTNSVGTEDYLRRYGGFHFEILNTILRS